MPSSPNIPDNYQVGGSLPIAAPTYVRRRADEDLYRALKAGEFCYILNSRQMGKSSLRVQAMQRLEAEGIACAAIDITAIGTYEITPEQWYVGMINRILRPLKLHRTIDLNAWWTERSLLSYVQRFGIFIEEVLLESLSQDIVIFIDEIDSVLSLKFNLDDFFALIRECYNQRADKPAYRRLTFALLGVATPSDLIQDKQRTPFNIGRPIELTGFQLAESRSLAQGLAAKTRHPEAMMQAVLDWTGGQPFLTQKVCKLILHADSDAPDGQEAAWVEDLVQAEVIENWEAQDNPEHLKTIRDRLLRSGEQRTGRLLGLYQQVLQRGRIEADDSPEQMELRLTGLVVKREGHLSIYNRIYGRVFCQDWLDKALAELRPYAPLFAAWVESDYQDESRLLRGQALQDAEIWAKGKSLSDRDYEFLAASQKLDKRDMQTKLDAEAEARGVLAEANRTANQRIRWGAVALGVMVAGAIASGISAQKSAQEKVLALSDRDNAREEVQTSHKENERISTKNNQLLQQIELSNEVFIVASHNLKQSQQKEKDAQQNVQRAQERVQREEQSAAITTTALAKLKQEYQLTEGRYNTAKQETQVAEQRVAESEQKIQGIQAQFKDISMSLAAADVRLQSAEANELFVSGQPFQALLVSLRTGQKFKRLSEPVWEKGDTRSKIVHSLGQTVYGVREHNSLKGHESTVNSVSFSPDGKTIASGSQDGTIELWSIDGRLLKTLKGHEYRVWSVSFSPDGKTIASGGSDGTIELWSIDGRLMKTLKGHENSDVTSVSFSPDGKVIAVSQDDTIKLWSIDGRLMKTLKGQENAGQENAVRSVSFSPDGKTIASGNFDNTIKLWSIDGRLLKTLKGHENDVHSVSFSPDGKTIASGSQDGTIKLWSIDGGLLQTLRGHESDGNRSGVTSVSFSPDGKTIASGSYDNTIKLWSIDGYLLQTLRGHESDVNGSGVTSVSFSPDGKTIASGSYDNTIKLWSIDGYLPQTLKEQEEFVLTSISFSPDGKMIASSNEDGTIKLWSIDGRLLHTFKGQERFVLTSVSISPDGKTIVSGSHNGTIKLWSIDGGLLQTLKGQEAEVYSVSFSPDGKTIASGSGDGTIKLWSIDGRLLHTFGQENYAVGSVSFSPDGKTIASGGKTTIAGSEDSTVKLWNIDGRLLHTFKGQQYWIDSVSFSPDGKTIASGSHDGTIKLWSIDGGLLQTLKGQENSGVTSLSFSPDGKTIASSSYDGTIKLWSIDGHLPQTLKGQENGVRSVSFSPDGKTIASSSGNTIKLWDWDVNRLMASGCKWIHDYLVTNPDASEDDRKMCGISGKKIEQTKTRD